ncbi:hypothetical protein SLEP1_g11527 [Rubroshorea leprosula]|nr:hypothetical protein SLEP1_g11527 [Rubroshorea leprosula]
MADKRDVRWQNEKESVKSECRKATDASIPLSLMSNARGTRFSHSPPDTSPFIGPLEGRPWPPTDTPEGPHPMLSLERTFLSYPIRPQDDISFSLMIILSKTSSIFPLWSWDSESAFSFLFLSFHYVSTAAMPIKTTVSSSSPMVLLELLQWVGIAGIAFNVIYVRGL